VQLLLDGCDAGQVALRQREHQAVAVGEVELEGRAVALAGGEADLPQRDGLDAPLSPQALGRVQQAGPGPQAPARRRLRPPPLGTLGGQGFRQTESFVPRSSMAMRW